MVESLVAYAERTGRKQFENFRNFGEKFGKNSATVPYDLSTRFVFCIRALLRPIDIQKKNAMVSRTRNFLRYINIRYKVRNKHFATCTPAIILYFANARFHKVDSSFSTRLELLRKKCDET